MKTLSVKPAALVALSLWLTAAPPVSAELTDGERAEWTTFAGGAPAAASVLTNARAREKIHTAFLEGTLVRTKWDAYWDAHGQKILEVEPYYQAKGAPATLTDTLLSMTQMLCDLSHGMTEESRDAYFKAWKEKDEPWIEAKKKFQVFPKCLDAHIDFLRGHVDAMPDAFVNGTLDLFLDVLFQQWAKPVAVTQKTVSAPFYEKKPPANGPVIIYEKDDEESICTLL
jgi:hypothetical protein